MLLFYVQQNINLTEVKYGHVYQWLKTGFGLVIGFIAQLYSSLQHSTNHYRTHYVFEVCYSRHYPLLGNGFQLWKFPFLWVAELSAASAISFSLLISATFNRLNQQPKAKVKVKVTLRLALYRQSLRLGAKPLETHDQRFFQLNPCDHSPYVTCSLPRRWVCLVWICLAFCHVYVSHI
jgi:hypothetical protein